MATTFEVEKMRCKGCAQHVVEAVRTVQPGAKVIVDLVGAKSLCRPRRMMRRN